MYSVGTMYIYWKSAYTTDSVNKSCFKPPHVPILHILSGARFNNIAG